MAVMDIRRSTRNRKRGRKGLHGNSPASTNRRAHRQADSRERTNAPRGLQGEGRRSACGLRANDGSNTDRCCRLKDRSHFGRDHGNRESRAQRCSIDQSTGEWAVARFTRVPVIAAVCLVAGLICRGLGGSRMMMALATQGHVERAIFGHRHEAHGQHGAQQHQRQQQRNDPTGVAAGNHRRIIAALSYFTRAGVIRTHQPPHIFPGDGPGYAMPHCMQIQVHRSALGLNPQEMRRYFLHPV